MEKPPQAVKDWQACVKKAKKKHNVPIDSWSVLNPKVYKTAVKCYCSMGY